MILHHGPRPNQPPRPVTTRRFAAYDAEAEQAVREGRIFKRQPTQITWCTHCQREYCAGDCSSTAFEKLAATLRGDTPTAAPVEEGYSSSEKLRPERRQVLYSPALQRRHKVKNAAIQTRKPRVQSRATQTEAEALPLPTPAPLALQRIIRLVLFLAAVSLLLAFAAGLPGAHAHPLTVGEHFPTSTMSLFRSFVSVSLVVVTSKFLVTHVSAAVTTIPDLPEPTTAAATIFISAIAAGYLLVRRPRPDTEEAVEVVDEEKRADNQWVPFLRDIAAPEFANFKKGLINDCHNKNTLREAVIALYARLQASLDLGNRQKEFISFLNDNPPWRDILTRLSLAVGKEEGDWLGAIQKAERWCKYAEVIQNLIWPLFPDIPEKERTANRMYQQVDDLRRLKHTVIRNATGHVFAHGLPVDTEKIEDLQHWVDAAPREFEKDVAMLFSPQPATRKDTLDAIQKLIAGERRECSHPQELAARMRNEVTTTWEESLRGIANLQALAPAIVVTWSAILKHFASLVRPEEGSKELEKENAELREELDDALIRLELLKGTTGGGPQKYSVPLFDTCFTDVCSWNTWRNQALAWAKENPMVLGTPANALSWFSRLLSGSAHDYVVSNIAKILTETQGIHEAVQAAAGLLDPFFADPDAETKAIKRFWGTRQGNQRFGLFYMDWQAARAALPNDSVSQNEQTRAFVQALRDGLRNKLEVHFLAQGVSRPTIEQYASFAPMLDKNCPDTACIPNTCHTDRQEFICPGGKGDDCKCGTKPANRREERKQPEKRDGATKKCCGAPASWLGHYRSCKYNYGNVNSRTNRSRRYARAQINAVWVCYIQETNVTDPTASVNHLQTTTFRKRVHATDPEHTEHERIRSKEVFGMVLAAVKQYRGSEEGWTQWCRTTGVCPDCWGIRDQDKFRDFVAESGGTRANSPSGNSQSAGGSPAPN